MELFACGHNEAGNLNLPSVCVRWHILGNNPCEHNNHCKTPVDPPYCPRMVTKLTRVLSAERIRLIHSSLNSTFLNAGGRLRIIGNEPEYFIGSNLVDKASEIVQIFEPEMTKSAFLMQDGSLYAQKVEPGSQHQPCGDLEQQRSNQSCEILHLAFQYSGESSYAIAKSGPQTVVTLEAGLQALSSWYRNNDEQKEWDTFDLPSAVIQIATNSRYMIALTEDHNVYTWERSKPLGAAEVQRLPASPAKAERKNSEVEEPSIEEDGPDMSSFLDDLPAAALSGTLSLSVSRYEKVPLPPVTKISASYHIVAAIANDRLYLWRDPNEKQYDKHHPTISSVGDPSSPTLQQILGINGEPLPIKDVSVGKSHIIALASNESMFSIGRGWHGELGIGHRQFELRVEEKESHNYDQEDAVEFAETWQEMDTEGLLGQDMEWVNVMAGDQTTFALARHIR